MNSQKKSLLNITLKIKSHFLHVRLKQNKIINKYARKLPNAELNTDKAELPDQQLELHRILQNYRQIFFSK